MSQSSCQFFSRLLRITLNGLIVVSRSAVRNAYCLSLRAGESALWLYQLLKR